MFARSSEWEEKKVQKWVWGGDAVPDERVTNFFHWRTLAWVGRISLAQQKKGRGKGRRI